MEARLHRYVLHRYVFALFGGSEPLLGAVDCLQVDLPSCRGLLTAGILSLLEQGSDLVQAQLHDESEIYRADLLLHRGQLVFIIFCILVQVLA